MDKLDIAPRFAFVWSPNPTLSVREGLGLSYDHFGSALIAHVTSGLPFAAYDGKGWSTNFDVCSWMVATGSIDVGGHKLDAKGNPNAFSNVTTAVANLRLPYPRGRGSGMPFVAMDISRSTPA